jgi:hypothetical protein
MVDRGGRVISRIRFPATVLILATIAPSLGALQTGAAPQCRPAGALALIPELDEASGIAASRRHPGRAWAINDSGRPELVMLDARGAAGGRVQLRGVTVDDWEALASGPCPGGSCLYLGDIGDNNANRKRITVYRMPEPDSASGTLDVRDAFHATYPDRPHDAETLLVTPKGEIFIVTKGEDGPVAVYRFPPDVKPGTTVALERVGNTGRSGKTRPEDRITDGAVSPSGAWIVLRTNQAVHVHPAADVTSGARREGRTVNFRDLREPQGEGVAFADDTTLYLVGEGGGKGQPGTFVRMTCIF